MRAWPRPISLNEPEPVQPENRVPAIGRRHLAPASRLLPNGRRRRHFAQREGEFHPRQDPGRTRVNPSSTLRIEKRSRSLFGESQQHPIAVRPPLLFKVLTRNPEKLSMCRVVDKDRSEEHTSELQSHHDLVCRLLLEKKK